MSEKVEVEIQSGTNLELEFQLIEPGRLEGKLYLFQCEDHSGIEVKATDLETGVTYLAATEADGSFQFEKLMPGTYRLDASKSGYAQQSISEASVVEQGKTVQVEPKTLLRSSYWTDLEDGTLQGWEVQSGQAQLSVVELGAEKSQYAMQVIYRLPADGTIVLQDTTGGLEDSWQDHNTLQLWVLGDKSGNALVVELTEASGQWEYTLPLDFQGYRRFDLGMQQFSFKGAGSPELPYPELSKLTACKLLIKKAATSAEEGTILIDEFYPYTAVTLTGKAIVARIENQSGITIEARGSDVEFKTQTDAAGNYLLSLPAGSYQVTAAKAGCTKQTREVVVDGYQQAINFQLEQGESGWLLLEDFEDPQRVEQLELVQNDQFVKSGQYSAKWANHPQESSVRIQGGDWSRYSRLNFWVYSEVANGAGIEVVFSSDNDETAGWDYYYTSFILDWTGWKHISIPLNNCGVSNNPVGWQQIDDLTFFTKGWGFSPNSTSVLYLDTLTLTSDQVQLGVLLGKAKLAGKQDHSGIKIEARSTEGLIYSTITDSKGQFGFESVLPGEYEIFASQDGFITAKATVKLEVGSMAQAEELSLTTLGRPNKPEEFAADASVPGEVRLSWRAPALSEDGCLASSYLIYRTSQGSEIPTKPYKTVVDPHPAIAGNQIAWADLNVDAADYDYYLEAQDSKGNASDLIGPLSVTAQSDTTPPGLPGSAAADVGTQDQVILTWNAPQAESEIDEAVAYRIYRSVAPDGPEQLVAEVNSLSWTDRELEQGQKYNYRITALDHVGNESEAVALMAVEPQITTIDVEFKPAALGVKGQALQIKATAETSSGTLTGKLFYKQQDQTTFVETELQQRDNNLFAAEIPAEAVQKDIEYYLVFSNGTREKTLPENSSSYFVEVVELDRTAVGISNLVAMPNPFFPTAPGGPSEVAINFTLGVPAKTTIQIYNMAGQLILSREQGMLSEGAHVYYWDGRDSKGSWVAAGPYLCQVTASEPNRPVAREVVLVVIMR